MAHVHDHTYSRSHNRVVDYPVLLFLDVAGSIPACFWFFFCHIALCFVSDYHIWKPVLTQNVMLTQNLFGFLCRAPKLRKFRNTKKGTDWYKFGQLSQYDPDLNNKSRCRVLAHEQSHHCRPWKIIIVVIFILPDFVFDVFTLSIAIFSRLKYWFYNVEICH